MFRRGKKGDFITNESSGYYRKSWMPEVLSLFELTMSKYGIKVEHRPGI